MTQYEIFDFLKRERLTGNDDFMTKEQIIKLLAKSNFNGSLNRQRICRQVTKLYAHGFLDIKNEKVSGRLLPKQSFRIKNKYLKVREPGDANVAFQDQ